MGHYSSFIVKVWTDETEDIARGYIQHVGTQETRYFMDLSKITEFILSHMHSQSGDLESEQVSPEGDSKSS
jgi:hypothetical protein